MCKDVWESFDQVRCIHFAPHKDRKESLSAELERLDLLPKHLANGKFAWHTTSTSVVNNSVCNAVMRVQAVVPFSVGI